MSLGLSPAEIVERYEDSTLAKHPDWPRVELKEVAAVQNGFAFPSSGFNQSRGMPLIRIRDVKRGATDTYFEGEFPPDYIVPAGSVLIGMDGDFNCAIWPGPDALLNQRVCRVRATNDRLDERYLAYLLPAYLKAVNDHTSSVTVKHLSSRTVERLPIPLPPLDEQKEIVAAIETQFARLDAAVAALQRSRTRLKRYRASVLKAACEGRLVPTEAELARQEGRSYEPASILLEKVKAERETASGKTKDVSPIDKSQLPDVPEGWAWCSLHDIGEFGRGKSKHRPRNDPKLLGGPYPFIQTADIRLSNGKITSFEHTYSEFGLAQSRLWPAGTLCITIAANIAETGILSFDACFPDSVVGFMMEPSAGTAKFIEAFIRTEKDNLERLAPATAQKNINLSTLSKIAVPLPPRVEQERIVEEVERRLSVVDQMEATIETNLKHAESLRQSILRMAFSGRLV